MIQRRWAVVLVGTACVGALVGGIQPSFASSGQASSRSECFRGLAPASDRAHARLPWPVVLDTACGSFVVFPDGAMMRTDLRPKLEPDPGYRVPAGTDSWAQVQQGHVVFMRDMHVVWRSAGAGYDPYQLDGAVLGPGWVAFIAYGDGGDIARVFLAALQGPERVIALNEGPLTVTPEGGLILSRWNAQDGNSDLVVRRADGSLARVAARKVSYVGAGPSGTVLYLDGSRVMRTDGIHHTYLADTTWVGGSKFASVIPLEDGRMALTGPDRIRIVAADGTIQSSAAVAKIPRDGWGYLGVQTTEPGTGAVVFTATHWSDENAGGGPGWEGVYRLPPGQSEARLLFGRRLDIAICAHSAQLSWHARWLLYSACEGRVVAIDTSGRHAPIVLSGVARSVPTPESEREYGLYGARWAPFASPSRLRDLARLG